MGSIATTAHIHVLDDRPLTIEHLDVGKPYQERLSFTIGKPHQVDQIELLVSFSFGIDRRRVVEQLRAAADSIEATLPVEVADAV